MTLTRHKTACIYCTLLILVFQAHCASVRRIQYNFFPPVKFVVSNESALRGKTHLILAGIEFKNTKPDESITANFRDNLRFELLRAGFTVEYEPRKTGTDKTTNDTPSKPTSTRALLVRGYIFESRTGELLDEQTTAGVYLSINSADGRTAAHLRYIGDTSLATYAESAEVGRLFAKRLKALTQARDEKAWWKFW